MGVRHLAPQPGRDPERAQMGELDRIGGGCPKVAAAAKPDIWGVQAGFKRGRARARVKGG